MLIGIDASRAVIARRTGTEVYSLHLIRNLVQIAPQHHFRFYLNGSPPPDLLPEGPQIEHRIISLPRMWTHLRLAWEVIHHPPDVLFVPSHVLPILHPKRSVVTVHDVGYHYYPEAHLPGQRRYLAWSTRYHTRAAAHILADSAATKDDLVHIYDANPAKITVAHLGLDPDLAQVIEADKIAQVRTKYGIAPNYMFYLGTLQPRKNLERLLDAYAKLLNTASDPEILPHLVLAGKKGWLYEQIIQRVKTLGLGNRVCLPGFVDDADRAALYSGATLFVMPSLYEGFCIPVLEAMACGTPVVCSNVSSIPEVVGSAAIQFDPLNVEVIAQTIQHVLESDSLRDELVKKGTIRAAQFTWRKCAEKTLAVLENC